MCLDLTYTVLNKANKKNVQISRIFETNLMGKMVNLNLLYVHKMKSGITKNVWATVPCAIKLTCDGTTIEIPHC